MAKKKSEKEEKKAGKQPKANEEKSAKESRRKGEKAIPLSNDFYKKELARGVAEKSAKVKREFQV